MFRRSDRTRESGISSGLRQTAPGGVSSRTRKFDPSSDRIPSSGSSLTSEFTPQIGVKWWFCQIPTIIGLEWSVLRSHQEQRLSPVVPSFSMKRAMSRLFGRTNIQGPTSEGPDFRRLGIHNRTLNCSRNVRFWGTRRRLERSAGGSRRPSEDELNYFSFITRLQMYGLRSHQE
jgi:hypothetical protein